MSNVSCTAARPSQIRDGEIDRSAANGSAETCLATAVNELTILSKSSFADKRNFQAMLRNFNYDSNLFELPCAQSQ